MAMLHLKLSKIEESAPPMRQQFTCDDPCSGRSRAPVRAMSSVCTTAARSRADASAAPRTPLWGSQIVHP